MKLFAIYIGGEFEGANIELHDIRFVVADSIEQTYDELRRQWWGIPQSLHLDCWAQLSHADGYDIELRPEPFSGPEKLYYINLGGYDAAEFLEKHRNVFIVATSINDAKKRAVAQVQHWDAPHRDDMYEAEQAFALDDAAGGRKLYLHLRKAAQTLPLAFTCDYKPL